MMFRLVIFASYIIFVFALIYCLMPQLLANVHSQVYHMGTSLYSFAGIITSAIHLMYLLPVTKLNIHSASSPTSFNVVYHPSLAISHGMVAQMMSIVRLTQRCRKVPPLPQSQARNATQTPSYPPTAHGRRRTLVRSLAGTTDSESQTNEGWNDDE